ncbi:MAG: ferrous iron transport protein B, partial [Bifidobacteriaceae bacterium]|nr:ferrous iron transport protein B [Bifidobacteriaceae bacterium]
IVLAHAFFYNNAGLIIFLLYIISVLFIIGISLICKVIRQLYNKKIALPKNRVSAFVIHLPVYQIPKFGFIFKSSLTKLTNFLWGAGRVIICVLAIMWCLQAIPVPNDNQTAETFGNVNNIHNSVYGLIADKTAPLFAPAGFGDWHLSQAIISGFLAKEVVLGSLSNAYAIDEVKTVSDNNTLTGSLQNTMNNASGGHVDLAAFSFMLFVLLYIPCLATVIGIKSEFGIRQSLITVLVSLSLAYIFSVLFYQIGIILLG